MNFPEIIVPHVNTDFDGFAAAAAASRLYPEARIAFGGSLNRNVREFYNLHADEIDTVDASLVDLERLRRLIMVDTIHCNRLGEFEPVCGREAIETIVFDHHRLGAPSERPAFVTEDNFVLSEDGSLVTTMLKIIHDRKIEVSPLEATIFALGIHEDTGSLTYPTTTARDAEALALSMRLGASQSLIGKYLHNPLSEEQRQLLLQLIDRLEPAAVDDVDVFLAAARSPVYVEGLSVVAHKIMDIADCQALIVAVEMEERIFVVGRSKSRLLDVARALAAVGGGGHSQAASAIIKGKSLEEARKELLAALPSVVEEPLRARDIMSHPVHFIDVQTPIAEALAFCQRHGHSGVSVREGGLLAGVVSRKDLDKAVAHKLGHAPVKGVMSREIKTVDEDAPLHELRGLMATGGVGRIPVVRAGVAAAGPVAFADVTGIVTRTDILRTLHGVQIEEAAAAAARTGVSFQGRLAARPELKPLLDAAGRLSADFRGAYLVGGFVRDLILDEPNNDIDIAVEGDGIEFARQLAAELGGRVRAHRKFNTAVVILEKTQPQLRVDVATARTEFYDYPAALPTVEHASIKRDLSRRDFTINAMAVSLGPEDFGRLLDFFGGLKDIEERVIRVLHNLSFIEDPTRIFRAIRYENRLGFRMNRHTIGLARGCVEMNLIGDLSSARLRDELIWLFSEPEVEHTILRIGELGLARSIHPALQVDAVTAELVRRADAAARRFRLLDEIRPWRLRLAALARKMDASQLEIWTERLKLKRADGERITGSVVMARQILSRLCGSGLTRAAVYEIMARVPPEAILLAWAETRDEQAAGLLELYLTELRFIDISISGRDLLAAGMKQSPRLGEILAEVRRLRIEGEVGGRQEQMAAARRLAGAAKNEK